MNVSELIRMLQQFPDDADVMIRLPYGKLYRSVDDTYLDVEGQAVIMVEPSGRSVQGARRFAKWPVP